MHRDTVGGEAQAEVRANAARQAPMVLGVVQLGSTMSNVFGKTVPTPKFFCNGCGHNQQPMGG